jgi:hypothetical protein
MDAVSVEEIEDGENKGFGHITKMRYCLVIV